MLAGLYCMIMLELNSTGMELIMTKFNILNTWSFEHITKRLQHHQSLSMTKPLLALQVLNLS